MVVRGLIVVVVGSWYVVHVGLTVVVGGSECLVCHTPPWRKYNKVSDGHARLG